MEFLDNLILGKNTPRYADESTFPSKTYKKNLCRKKHCDKFCYKDLGGDWEFWEMTMSCKPLNRLEIGNKMLNMKGCIRFGMWYRMCVEEERDGIETRANKDGIPNEERDKVLLDLILKKFRNRKIDEEALFNTLIAGVSDKPTDLVLFIEFIFNVLDLPFADVIYLKNILRFTNDKLKLYEIFLENTTEHQENDKELEKSGEVERKPPDKTRERVRCLVEHLIHKDFMYFCKLIDFILCYQNTTFLDALSFFIVGTGESDFESLCSLQNLTKLKDYLENKQNTLEITEIEKPTDPTYYDFIVVQNETIKAQEHIKEEYVTRINDLEKENKELRASLDHFKEISGSLEQELSDYQDGYVKEISKLLDESGKENDSLQKEVLRLKDELCKVKRNVK